MLDQEWSLEALQHYMDIPVETFHPDQPSITEKRKN